LNKILILVRHAHRDKDEGRELDNGLSERGRRQARALTKFFAKAYPEANPVFLSSPKKRCRETLLKVESDPLLDEGSNLEGRVAKFTAWWKTQGPQFTVACSHGDWLPVCIEALSGARVELKKGALAEIHLDPDATRLYCLLQKI
jgi:phosphohistidine phosphatase SixA